MKQWLVRQAVAMVLALLRPNLSDINRRLDEMTTQSERLKTEVAETRAAVTTISTKLVEYGQRIRTLEGAGGATEAELKALADDLDATQAEVADALARAEAASQPTPDDGDQEA